MNPEHAKIVAGFLLNGIQMELSTTKNVLAAIPNENHEYRPDPKSKTAMELAWHIASVDVWFMKSILAGAFGSEGMAMPEEIKSGADLAAWYEKSTAAEMPALLALSGEDFAKIVPFYHMQMPNVAYLSFLNNHMIHHRGQLSTYLRAMGGKCPSIYGGSADEPMQG
jgi:uncharacterized damage-inducible protein DinB